MLVQVVCVSAASDDATAAQRESKATLSLMNAASRVGVRQFILISALGAGKFDQYLPAGALITFFISGVGMHVASGFALSSKCEGWWPGGCGCGL